jgi:mono/diheme cytochrome c family protein
MSKAATLLLLALPTLNACGSKGDESATGNSGRDLFQTYCAACHGEDARGTMLNLGPSLEGVRQYWEEATLLEYIDNPKAFAAGNERLGKREMTAIASSVPMDARERLVEYALSLMD